MKVVAGLTLLLVNVRLSRSCYGEGQILFCLNIPAAFPPGISSLVMILEDVGEINSTVFHSHNLFSVTRLRIENAGVTGIAEGAFSSFKNLTDLTLNQNLLTEINPSWFGRPDFLSELSLTGNQIEVLNEFMLSGLNNLTRLSLSKNRIRTIDPNSFSSQTVLAELDLSENRMSQVSPRVFRSLGSTRIRLDGNPWGCSCEAQDFVDFLKDLQSRSVLDRQGQVTCESPPSLRGRPVWNVSVCVTSPPPRPLSVQPKPTDILTPGPASTGTSVVTTPSARPTLQTETSVQPKPTDLLTPGPASTGTSARFVTSSSQPTPEATTSIPLKPTDAPLISSSHTATPPARPTAETKTSVQPKPTDVPTRTTAPALKTETSSPPSATGISVHPTPSDLPITTSTPPGMTETCATSRPSSDTNKVCTLVVVIVVLSVLLCVVCFLVVLHRRKRNNKTVMPGCMKENRNESKEEEDGSRSSRAQSPGQSEKTEDNHWDSEMGWRRSFTGVRAKSANAILFTSPFCAPVKDQMTLQSETEAPTKDTDNQADDEQKPDGGFETELTKTTDVNAKQAAAVRNLDKDPLFVSDTVPYLSIGTSQSKPDDFNKQSTEGPRQSSQKGKVMRRISTWPPTVVQWQARCKMMEKEGSDVFTVWTPKFPSEVKNVERPSGSDRAKEDEKNQSEDPRKMNEVGHSQSSTPNNQTTSLSEAQAHVDMKKEGQLMNEEMIQDPATARQTISKTQNLNQEKLGQTRDLKPAVKTTDKSGNRTEQRNEPKRAVTSRQKAENRSTGSKAPSGGASPDDETLLSGNEYAFMDLLHEVVQNNGRWTRERWRQIHVNKQRR